jgi:hypothetical protein
MNLSNLELEVIKAVRELFGNEWEEPDAIEGMYLCIAVTEIVDRMSKEEHRQRKNRIMFWRKGDISRKWLTILERITGGIQSGIGYNSTVGKWFEEISDKYGIHSNPEFRHNFGLYRQIRLAWLDRIIETGTIA